MEFKCAINKNIINKSNPHAFGWHNEKLTKEQLAYHIVQGFAFSPGILNNDGINQKKPTIADIQSAQLICVDIDNSIKSYNSETRKYDERRKEPNEGYITFPEVVNNEWIRKNALLAYTTPTHTLEHHKLRIVFLLPEQITDPANYSNLTEVFIDKFGSDKSCKNIDRMFFGNNKADIYTFGSEFITNQLTQEELNQILYRYNSKQEANDYNPSNDITVDQVKNMLSYIPTQMDYNDWGKIVSAVGNYFDEETAVSIIDGWSPDQTVGTRYKIQHRHSAPNIGSVVWMAKQYGFDPKKLNGKLRSRSNNSSSSYINPDGEIESEVDSEEAFSDKKISQIDIVEEFLMKHYNFKYNSIKGYTEFKRKDGDKYDQLRDINVNEIWRLLHKKKIKVTKETINNILESNFVPEFDPIDDYFSKLPEWDGEKHIDKFIERIKVPDSQKEIWVKYFYHWIVGTVACATKFGLNHNCIVLVGGQSIGKTTIIQKLVPKQLKHYSTTGAINPTDKDSKILVAENFLINLDELETSTIYEIGFLKSLITAEDVTVRRPFARRTEKLIRRASFIGSINRSQFLNDVTGTRRFLTIDVEDIDITSDLDVDQLYAEAKFLLNSGFQYWFTKEEALIIDENNRKFMQIQPEQELVTKHFIPYDPNKAPYDTGGGRKEPVYLTATEMFNDIAKNNNALKLSIHKLGSILKKLGFEQVGKRRNGIKGNYYKCLNVEDNTFDDIKEVIASDDPGF